MPNEVLVKAGTQLVWADATDFDNYPYADDYQLDLTGLTNGAARQGAQGDLGETRARQWSVTLNVEINVAPVSATTVDVYWAPSADSVPASGNPGGITGSDAAYTGTAGDSLDDSLKQLDFLGSLICTADIHPAEQHQLVSVYRPPTRYGSPVVYNKSGQAMVPDAFHAYILFQPIVDEIQ
jgi:hypothetical protein